jgi:hypothetical protein
MLAYRFVGSPWHVSLGALAGIVLAASMPAKRQAAGDLAMTAERSEP